MATTNHKEGKAGVKVIYFPSKTLSDGSHPFLVRIRKDNQRKYIATGLSLHPQYWDTEKQQPRRHCPDRESLLLQLAAWEKKYQEVAKDLVEADEAHSSKDVAQKAAEVRQQTRIVPTKLLAYCTRLSEDYARAGQSGNTIVYRDLRNQLAKYVGGANQPPQGRGKEAEWATWLSRHDIPMAKVTVSWCKDWEIFLRGTGLQEVTLSLRFRTLRAVLNHAIAAKQFKLEDYPFARTVAEQHKFTVGKFDVTTAKRAITRDELRRLEDLTPTTPRLALAKAVFLFSYYGGGINWVDLAQLRWKNLSGPVAGAPDRLQYTRQKTNGKFSLKLLAPAQAIVATYYPLTHQGAESYVFPVLNHEVHLTPTQQKNRLHKVLGQVNPDLKLLGKLAGISTPLTTYVARHSFATTLKHAGKAVGVISQAMGHKSEAVTAVYLDSFASDLVDDAFEALL
jgi:integrase